MGEQSKSRDADGRPLEYRTRLLESVMGISRSTLLYYEKIGIVNPSRTEGSSYRGYTNTDVGGIIACTLLKNCGYGVNEAGDLMASHADASDSDECRWFLDECLAGNARERARNDAIHDELERLRGLYAAESLLVPRVVSGEEWVFFPNQAEPLARTEGDDVQRSLFRGAPLSSTACLFEDAFDAAGPLVGVWGRAIQMRLLELYPDVIVDVDHPSAGVSDRTDARELRGAPDNNDRRPRRLVANMIVSLPFSTALEGSNALDADGALRSTLRRYAAEQGLTLSGAILMSDYLPVHDTLYATLYAPARPTRRRIRVRRVRAGA